MADSFHTLVVLGPTASGKTGLAVRLAQALRGEILSADSRQVYRELTIGSGKDLAEYTVGGERVPYHLIDVATVREEYNVFRYQRDCWAAWKAVRGRRHLPVLCGGTGMYLEAVLSDYGLTEAPPDPDRRAALEAMDALALGDLLNTLRPDQHNATDLADRRRTIRAIEVAEAAATGAAEPGPPIKPLILGTAWPRDVLRKRILARLKSRLEAGLVEEVRDLLADGVDRERLYGLGLEYRYVTAYLEGSIRTENDLVQKLASSINQFAKRQETWFRRMEKHGHVIHWVDGADFDAAMAVVEANR